MPGADTKWLLGKLVELYLHKCTTTPICQWNHLKCEFRGPTLRGAAVSLRARKGQIHLKVNTSVFILVKFGAKYVSKDHPQQFVLRVMFVYSNTEMHLLLRYFHSFSVSSWPYEVSPLWTLFFQQLGKCHSAFMSIFFFKDFFFFFAFIFGSRIKYDER